MDLDRIWDTWWGAAETEKPEIKENKRKSSRKKMQIQANYRNLQKFKKKNKENKEEKKNVQKPIV